MIPATEPRTRRETARLLLVDSRARQFADRAFTDLPDILQPGDLLVVNDAATIPASLPARAPSGHTVELRLMTYLGQSEWKAALLGEGDWRTPTELRDPPAPIVTGTLLNMGSNVTVEVMRVERDSSRIVTIRFSRDASAM